MQVLLLLFISTFNLGEPCNLEQIRSTFFSINNEAQLTEYIELCDSIQVKTPRFHKYNSEINNDLSHINNNLENENYSSSHKDKMLETMDFVYKTKR